jgi:hypothetical protein
LITSELIEIISGAEAVWYKGENYDW